MGWGSGRNSNGRKVGYAIEAECDYPDCTEQIDRGLGFVCGDHHYGMNDWGCGDYFCENHRYRDEHPNGPCGQVDDE